jgi:hypothetical protein
MALSISDHALLRWLERVKEFDLKTFRDEIWATPGLKEAAALGAVSFAHGGLVFRLDAGRLITIQPGDSPRGADTEARRNKHGRTVKLKGAGFNQTGRTSSQLRRGRPEFVPEGDE